ncbi:MAG: UxaA family hydrolase, partial [Erysipelotrichales bacterium]|nr:UxaA family hydrolase [Erysipelotrichales bacterium]
MRNTIHIHPDDNVCVALHDLHAGDAAEHLILDRDIPKGHKIALKDIHEGEFIVKYGQVIGKATAEIKTGEHVHSHNMRTNLDGILDYVYNPVPQNDRHEVSPYKLTGY